MPSCPALQRLSPIAKSSTQIRAEAKKKYNAKQLTTLAPYTVRHLHLPNELPSKGLARSRPFRKSSIFLSTLSKAQQVCVEGYQMVSVVASLFSSSVAVFFWLCLCEWLFAWRFGNRSMGAFYAFVILTNLFVVYVCESHFVPRI